jgi:hypothetical protein
MDSNNDIEEDDDIDDNCYSSEGQKHHLKSNKEYSTSLWHPNKQYKKYTADTEIYHNKEEEKKLKSETKSIYTESSPKGRFGRVR